MAGLMKIAPCHAAIMLMKGAYGRFMTKTTVRSFRGQCLVAFLVAAVEAGFRLLQFVHAPYYALFIVGPTANLVEIAMDRRRRTAPATAPVSAS